MAPLVKIALCAVDRLRNADERKSQDNEHGISWINLMTAWGTEIVRIGFPVANSCFACSTVGSSRNNVSILCR
jgi:hypothetical protein